jgi:uncharacterized membrane-anchored protein YhcB (DUF1043 family)
MIIAAAIAALLVGGGLGFLLGSRRGRQADARVAKAEAELEAYRGNVTDHFRQTAVRFRELGEQYRSLHEHLAQGAESLCDVSRGDGKLRFEPLTALEAPETGRDEDRAAAADDGPQAAAEPIVATRDTPPVDYELPAMAADRPSPPDTDDRAGPETGDEPVTPEKTVPDVARDRADTQAEADAESSEAGRKDDAEPGEPERAARKEERPRTIH